MGQEVLKAVSGKFHPIHQFFYFDSIESLPENGKLLAAEEYEPAGTRCARMHARSLTRPEGSSEGSAWPGLHTA